MVEYTDVDLAIAVALAESNDAVSDDDFKPLGPRVGFSQRRLLQTCPAAKKKQVKIKPDKKQGHPILAVRGKNGQCQVENLSKDWGKQKKVRKDVKKMVINLSQHKSVSSTDVNRSTSISSAELDKFRFKGGPGVPPPLEITAPIVTNDLKSVQNSTARLESSMELRSPPQSGVEHVPRDSAADHSEECLVIDINTEEVVELVNESQFSVLLRLCGEEYVEDEQGSDTAGIDPVSAKADTAPVNCVSALVNSTESVEKKEASSGAVESLKSISEEHVSISLKESGLEGLAPVDLDGQQDASGENHNSETDLSVVQIGNDGKGPSSPDQFCKDNTDDISSLMTQQCLPPMDEVKAPHRTSLLPLQNISNLATRLDASKQPVKIKQSLSQAADRINSSCMYTDDALEKINSGPTGGSIVQSHGPEVSIAEKNCPSNWKSGGPCCTNLVNAHRSGADSRERSQCGEAQEVPVSYSGGVGANMKCPVCGDNISEISVEQRLTHTNSCLDKLDGLQDCSKEEGVRSTSCIEPNLDKVRDWLVTLHLSRYFSLFVEQEIDWETLQWLTEEDLVMMGISAVGPRRKILRALEDLKTENGSPMAPSPAVTNPELQIPAADVMIKNPLTNGGDSTNLITNYFPLPSNSGKKPPSTSETNMLHQKVAGGKQPGVFKNKASKRPRSSVYQNISGVPAWMCIPGTAFRVDAFQHLNGDCYHWFLTHFHTDHYQGLTRGFRYGRIYCSLITARLVNLRIGVSWDKLMIIPLNEKFMIDGVNVTFIDANHCPGSVMILFEPPNGEAVLHTGDFRFCTEMASSSLLQSVNIHTLVLDTTYCDPQYDFPTQQSVVQFVIEAIQAEAFNSETLFLIGTYTIGKERIFLEVAKVLKKYVYVGAAKKKLLDCMDLNADDTQWLTCNDKESFIHVVPLWSISSFKRMQSIARHYEGRFKSIVAFSPSGWSFGRGKKKTPGKRWKQGTMIRYEVPYSEHCSFSELKEFLKFVGPEDIIPSVPDKSGKGTEEMIASLWSGDK